MISATSIFAIVEGRTLDSPFYDRLLDAHPPAARLGFEIRLAEQISPAGISTAGGKDAVLALHDYYARRKLLKQTTKSGPRHIVFFVDRDFDHLENRTRRSANIIYTEWTDVEAEIHRLGNLPRALASTLSLTSKDSDSVSAVIGDSLNVVAVHWREWIELCCLAVCLKARCGVHPSSPSKVNRGAYGTLDPVELSRCTHLVRTKAVVPNAPAREKRIRTRVSNIYSTGAGGSLVKGKWIPGYLEKQLRDYFGSAPIDYNGFKSGITRALLDSIDFSGPWTGHWTKRLDQILT